MAIFSNNPLIDFYKLYPKDHWMYKLSMMINIIDNYDSIKDILHKGWDEVNDKAYLGMLNAEIHFTYFQMVEALFQMIFVLEERLDKDLWYCLSSHQWRKKQKKKSGETYKRIADFIKNYEKFLYKEVELTTSKKISLIEYIFYHYTKFTKLTEDEIKKNFENIKLALLIFARDFTDRDDYNAYKHGLRFYHSSQKYTFYNEKTKISFAQYGSENVISYLREEQNGDIFEIHKAFDPKRDFNMANLCHQLISNIIEPRRCYFLKQKLPEMYSFDGIDINKLNTPKNTLTSLKQKIGEAKK